MKHHPLYLLTLMAALLFSTQAAAGTQFSADMVQKAGGETSKMRYYQGDQKMRTEMKNEDGQVVVSIIDLKTRIMLKLMPKEKMYMELPMGGDSAAWAADEKTQNEYYDMKPAGTETVNGYVCDKYNLIPKKQGLEKATTWISRKLSYPIKSVSASHSMELTNIREGAQPASLFEVPKGYQKMPGMDEYYRGMMKGKSDQETAGPQQRRRK
jgi:outer membrane lipoprotein-sorting protein